MSREAWETVEEINAAKERLSARMPRWRMPAAYGVVLVPEAKLGTDDVRFPVVNNPVHGLPALVLGLVTGRRDESGTFDLSPSELDGAVALLSPAEAATTLNHPNLLAWRQIAEAWGREPGARAFAVFISDFADPATSPYDDALRRQIEQGERNVPIYI
jgi:hypothetical protein